MISPASNCLPPLHGGKFGLLFGLIVFTVFYRLAAADVPALGNTAPLMALAFGGALLLGRRFWWVPALLLVASDLLLGLRDPASGIGAYTLFSALFYLAVGFAAARLGRSTRSWVPFWGGTLLAGVLFYVLANTFAWTATPAYAKTWAGWWQSQTVGLPQFSPPAWHFLRNALLADTLWCALAGLLFFRRPAAGENRNAVPVGVREEETSP